MPDTLQTSIELYDRATKPLRTIASAAETVTKAFKGVDTSASQAFGDMPSQINTAERAIKSGADQTRRFESQLKNVNSAGGNLVGTVKRGAGAIGAAFGVSTITVSYTHLDVYKRQSDDSKDAILEYELSTVEDMILNYCNIKEIPDRLENILVGMCADYHRASGYGDEEGAGIVKSVSEGDTSVSYASAYSVSENPGMEFLKGYTAQLNRFRRFGK